jgi:hypothetical protein
MITYIRPILLIALVLLSAERSFAKDWRGITPLRSTRADVIRLLNQCSDQREACVFSLAQEDVYILFSGGLGDEYVECSKSLPPETVMFIHVEPKTKLKLDDLRLDKKKLRVFGPSAPISRGSKGYETIDGLVIETFRGRIVQLEYIADPSDRHRCPAYYEQPESFIHTLIIHPPLGVYILCPDTAVTAGTNLVLRAYADVNAKRGPTWRVNAGKILSGQHTYKVILDKAGLASQTIEVTAEMADAFGHVVPALCKVSFLPN